MVDCEVDVGVSEDMGECDEHVKGCIETQGEAFTVKEIVL